MTIIDGLLIATLTAFVGVWWLRRLPSRPAILLGLALLATALGAWGALDDRWQDGVGAGVGGLGLLTLLVNRLRRSGPARGAPFVSGTLFALLALGATAAVLMFPVAPLPTPSGPNRVGVRDFEVADASRPGVFKAGPTEPRRLLVRVWYPAGDVSGRRPRPYFTPREAQTLGRSIGQLVGFPPLFTYLRHVRTNSYPDAPLKPGLSGAPVVFYSHGYTAFLGQNTALMEDLASHGYVVFSVQHTYDSTTTLFPNGDVAPADPDLFKGPATGDDDPGYKAQVQAMTGAGLDARLDGYLRMHEVALARNTRIVRSGAVWAADRMFVHDRLQRGDVPGPIRSIVAASRLDRVGEMGMSFGGATSGTVCMIDRRCAAGANLDGGDFPFVAFGADMPAPFLMFHSDVMRLVKDMGGKPGAPRSFNEFSYESFGAAGTRADIHRVQLNGARHLGLSDFSLFMRRPLRDPLLGRTPAAVMIGAQNVFVRGFFDRYLKGLGNGFPRAELAAYPAWLTPIDGRAVQDWWRAKPPAERAAIEARIARVKAAGPAMPTRP